MSDAVFAKYIGDSRSSWERLTWIEPHRAHRTHPRRRDDLSRVIVADPVLVEEVPEAAPAANARRKEAIRGQTVASDDQIDFDLRKWDSFDFVTALGFILLAIGFIAALSSDLRKVGVLVPVGLGIMTLGVLGARQRDTKLS